MLNEKDLLIINELEKSADFSTKELSRRLGIPPTTIHNRIKSMRKTGVIKRYVAELDYKKIGKSLTAYVLMDIDHSQHFDAIRKIQALPFVYSAVSVTGQSDVIIKIRVKNPEELGNIVIKRLRKVNGIKKTETMLVIETIK